MRFGLFTTLYDCGGGAVTPADPVLRNLYVAPTMEAARREAETSILSAFIYNDPFRGREVFTNPGEELAPGVKLDWEFLEPRNLLVGPPEHVAERVHELAEVCGLETLLVEHAHPGIPQRLILRNLELFATKVMPAFRRDLAPASPIQTPSRDGQRAVGR
jgi:alkanesulfonate monooxygenase SsuD/methylene tetrahydromethanopterin reductase-like flavin-dependent oxidoreductase (luciferase family)